MITVKEFKTAHNLNDSAFKRLTARVRSARPDLNLTARVPGSSTEWQVLEPEILAQALTDFEAYPAIKTESSKPKKTDAVEAEIIESYDLANGSQLAVRKEVAPVPFIPRLEIATETRQVDYSKVDLLIDQLRTDLQAKQEADRLSRLYEHAQRCQEEKKHRDLIEMLISQGYSAEQAIVIAQGAQNLQPVGK